MSYAKKVRTKTLPSGARFFATPFPSRDIVSISGSIKGGARLAGSSEFANIHAAMLLEGTSKRSKKEIQEYLDTIGASLSFSSSSDRLNFSGYARPHNIPKLVALVAEILMHASFPSRELSVLKKRETANLTYAAQDTRTQAGIALWRLLVPKGHPNYAETTDESLRTLSTITSKKLAAYHSSTLDQSSLIFSIAGDIEIDSMFALAEKHFKKFPVRSIELPSFTPSTPSSAEKVIIPIEHKESVDYLVGIATGITQRHEDYPALLIGMNVLGAPNFSGRLMSTVREKEGLTYGVYANTSGFARHNDGALIVWAAFAPQMFDRGRAAVIREIKKLITRGATTDEIKKHSFMYLARKKTGLTTSSAYAALAHDLAADDLPLSHIDSFDKKIEKLTAADVNKALKKYLVPKLLSEAAAGPVEQNAFGR